MKSLNNVLSTLKSSLYIILVNAILQVLSVDVSISKCMIALPTDAEHVRVFEKTLIGSFSCVNTRLAFDTEILIKDKGNERVLFNLNIDGKKQIKRVSTKILKMDGNNQYGQAITKALPYGCIKRQEHPPSLAEFNKILDRVSHEDNIGHLFIVDIKFHDKNPKTLMFNEIYPPIFERTQKWSLLKGKLYN